MYPVARLLVTTAKVHTAKGLYGHKFRLTATCSSNSKASSSTFIFTTIYGSAGEHWTHKILKLPRFVHVCCAHSVCTSTLYSDNEVRGSMLCLSKAQNFILLHERMDQTTSVEEQPNSLLLLSLSHSFFKFTFSLSLSHLSLIP